MKVSLGAVLLLAAVVSAPAWWLTLTGRLPLEVALTRGAVAVAVVWAGCWVLALLVGAPQASTPVPATTGADGEPPPL